MEKSEIIYNEDKVIIKEIDRIETIDKFINNIKIQMVKKDGLSLQFDIINCTPALANGIRRVITAEIECYAFHELSISENSTIFPDEYLAHRIGLIPVKLIGEYKNVDYVLDVHNISNDNLSVYSNDIKTDGDEIFNISQNVLICKLAPNNKISMRLKISGGQGKTHTKWSPVSLCTYRLMPRITLNREFRGEEALRLKECCSPGVIEINESGIAYVSDPRKEKMSREVVRVFNDNSVTLGREENHYCFEIEGLIEDPVEILRKGISKLRDKSIKLSELIKEE